MLTLKRLAETVVKMTSRRQKRLQNQHTDVMRVVLHPSCKMTFPSPGRVHGNPSWVCKKNVCSIPTKCPKYSKIKKCCLKSFNIFSASDKRWNCLDEDEFVLHSFLFCIFYLTLLKFIQKLKLAFLFNIFSLLKQWIYVNGVL